MRGISPLISMVIIIAFTIAIATIITGSLTTVVKTQTEQATHSATCPGSTVDIQFVSCTSDILKVVILNAGNKEFTTFGITAKNGTHIYTNATVAGDTTVGTGKLGTLEAYVGPTLDGALSELKVSVGNCPGLSVAITNVSGSIATCP